MKVGIIYPQTELGGSPVAVRRIGLAAEELGFDHLLAYDHVLGATHDREPRLIGPYTEKDPFHDPLIMFAYLAGLTKRLHLITGILILPQRQTVLVARQTADLDLLSEQRFRLGVGLGWNYVEYESLGQDFHVRGKRITEQISLLRKLWTEPLVTFHGEFDRVERAAINPRPTRSIPIWLSGFVDTALRRAAKIAEGFIFSDGVADAFAQAARLREYLDAASRSCEDFGFHINMLRAKTPSDVLDTVRRWKDAGGTHASVSTMGHDFTCIEQHVDYMQRIAEVTAEFL